MAFLTNQWIRNQSLWGSQKLRLLYTNSSYLAIGLRYHVG